MNRLFHRVYAKVTTNISPTPQNPDAAPGDTITVERVEEVKILNNLQIYIEAFFFL